MQRDFYQPRTSEGETVTQRSEVSRAGLLVSWLSIPTLLLIAFMTTCMPHLIKMAVSKAFREALAEQFGVESFGDLELSRVLSELIFESVPGWLIALLCVPLVVLVVAWLGLCLYKTSRHYGYALVLTDRRVLGRAGNEEMDAPLETVVNVFLEQSLAGKVFNYGNIVVHTKGKSLTFKNLRDPKHLYKAIMQYAENYAAH